MDPQSSSPNSDSHDTPPFEAVYTQLRALAGAHFRAQAQSHTLQPTALVHEAYMKLSSGASDAAHDERHLLALASRAMRHVLVDHARKNNALKRGGVGQMRVTLSEVNAKTTEWDVLELEEALVRLEALDPRQASIVEMRFFGGLSVQKTAELLDISERTVHLDWQMAKAWLISELGEMNA